MTVTDFPTQHELVQAIASLSDYLQIESPSLKEATAKAAALNPWFSHQIKGALTAISHSLAKERVEDWLSRYSFEKFRTRRLVIGLVLAGNIPAVGLYDVLAVIASGNIAHIKLSSVDSVLIPFLLSRLSAYNPSFENLIVYKERLKDLDAVVATGSNNSARYFEYYFSSIPHIIRKNRNSVAVLTGFETNEQLQSLGQDVFLYYGMGCRSVSKLYVPKDYDFGPFFKAIEPWRKYLDFHKYANNYQYQLTLKVLNRQPYLSSGFLLVSESESLHAPIASLNYSVYESLLKVAVELESRAAELQCICSAASLPEVQPLGSSQKPELWDYPDRRDLMNFFLDLKAS